MGTDSRLEDSPDRTSLRAFYTRRDLSHFCGGRFADGDRVWDVVHLIEGCSNSALGRRPGAAAGDLVLRGTNRLAGLCHSGYHYALRRDLRLDLPSAGKHSELALYSRTHHFDLGPPATVPGRLS